MVLAVISTAAYLLRGPCVSVLQPPKRAVCFGVPVFLCPRLEAYVWIRVACKQHTNVGYVWLHVRSRLAVPAVPRRRFAGVKVRHTMFSRLATVFIEARRTV